MVKMEMGISKKYSCRGLINLIKSAQKPTQQALAIEYAMTAFPVFVCDISKAPIVDRDLNFIHGIKDATTDLKLIARAWHKYPDAGIGLALSQELIVFDCDVEKDTNKKPIPKDGKPNIIGLKSFQNLIIDLKISEPDLNTLSIKTQSGGRHYYYRMPAGISSFNHTHALEGLDLKGYGGYVILPNSQGQYGKYEFLNLTEIRPIPKQLLDWVLKFKGSNGEFKPLPSGTAKIDREEIAQVLEPYWAKGDGRRNDLTMAIAGFIAHSGGSENDATYVISKLCELTGKGCDHIPGAKYAFRRDGPVRGFRSLEQLMEDIGHE